MLFNEPKLLKFVDVEIWQTDAGVCFSALQRAEIAEILLRLWFAALLNESFSALQRAEIAEIRERVGIAGGIDAEFQCSSTSRNC